MSRPARRFLWALVAGGIVLRVVLAFTTDGQPYDIESLRLQRRALSDSVLHAYAVLDVPGAGYRFPYPPGFFAFIGLAGTASDATGLAYTSLVRLPSVFADAAIALVVQDFLGRRGASDRVRLAATALVALGPIFIATSGYHGQIDGLAILPAVAALAVWDRAPEPRRALYAGLLIGLGGTIKTTPLFTLLALLPAVRSWRQAATLVGAALAVPVAATLPFFLTTPDAVRHALGYRGFPGTSGLSLILQPGLGEGLVHRVTPGGVVEFLHDHGQLLVGAAVVAVAALARRLGTAERAALIWLGFYIVTPVYFSQYLVWGLPFMLMARRLRLAAAIQALATAPMLMFYLAPWESDRIAIPYVLTMAALWALYVAGFVTGVRRRPAAVP